MSLNKERCMFTAVRFEGGHSFNSYITENSMYTL
jgi:hypothetical protein